MTKIAWSISASGDLECAYFPVIDGTITALSIGQDNSSLTVHRKDLGETCIIAMEGVRRAHTDIYWSDIVSRVEVKRVDARNCAEAATYLADIYGNYRPTDVGKMLERDMKSAESLVAVKISFNMGSRLAVLATRLDLFLEADDGWRG